MRTQAFVIVALLVSLTPSCSLVLDLGPTQGGDAGAGLDVPLSDTPGLDAPVVDASEDAPGLDAPRRDAPGTDAPGADVPGTDAPALDAGVDAPGDLVEVTGTVVGLSGSTTVRLGNDGVEQAVGAGTFTFSVPRGDPYDVQVITEPTDRMCVVYRGSGTATADVSDVFVGCSTSVDLVSYFPFDGDEHAARGRDWTDVMGVPGFVTDRAGQPDHALGEMGGMTARLDYLLDGRSGTVPTGGAQFTVSLWALVPSATVAGTTIDLFGHYNFSTGSAGPVAQINWAGGMPYFALYFYWDGGFSQVLTESTTRLPRTEWHHVAVTVTGPDVFERRVYVDGVREGTLNTCCGWGNGSRYWAMVPVAAQRDDVRLYSRRLDDTEIAAIYAAENVP